MIVGTGFDPPRFNQNRLIIFELEVIGAYNYNDKGFGRRSTSSAAGRCLSGP